MTPVTASVFDTLRAPAGDGEVLIEPAMRDWPSMIDRNRSLRAKYHFDVDGQPAAVSAGGDAPVILVGHQPEFFHPGVWAKNVAAVRHTAAAGGSPCFLIVDNDAPERTTIRWPQRDDSEFHIAGVDMRWSPPGAAFECQPARDAAQWAAIWNEIPFPWRVDPHRGLPRFLAEFTNGPHPASDSRVSDYVERWCTGIRALDRWIGIPSPQFTRASRLSCLGTPGGVTWGHFVRHLANDAAAFASIYNKALSDYRVSHRIGNPKHPIPDLHRADGRTELPLWAYRGPEPRRRLYARRSPEAVMLDADGIDMGRASDVGNDGDIVGWHIRPRALTLTLYTRLLCCDLFIHGLGGARYDVVTDEIIRHYFNVKPPAYACVTATLRLDIAHATPPRGEVDRALRILRDSRHNPQRLLPPSLRDDPRLAKRATAVAESDRLRRCHPEQHVARRRIFDHIHQINDELRLLIPDAEARATAQLQHARAIHDAARVANSREWFYGLYTRESLQRLAEALSPASTP